VTIANVTQRHKPKFINARLEDLQRCATAAESKHARAYHLKYSNYYYYYYYYYIRLTAFFQDNLGKLAPEK